MTSQIIALIYILIISSVTFTYLKVATRALSISDELPMWAFNWMAIVSIAFLSQNFMLFSLATAILIFISSKIVRDPFAFYCVLLIVIPTYAAKVSVFFSTSITRELALLVLVPIMLISAKKTFYEARPGLKKFGKLGVDKLIIVYLIYKSMMYFRGLSEPIDPLTPTEVVRQSIYIVLELFLPYYVASRYIKDFKDMQKVLFALFVAGLLAGVIAIFEFGRSWLLFGDLHRFLGIQDWGQSMYIGRSNAVRAKASLEHPLVLGLMMLITSGIYLYLSKLFTNRLYIVVGALLLIGGILAPLSRGPWMGAILMIVIFFSMGHNKAKNITYLVIGTVLLITALSFTSYSEKMLDLIPFVGKVDKFNVDYRSQLIDQSLLVIQNYPFFGVFDPTLEPELQKLVQGQGIIDLVNYYLELTLTYGIFGFMLFFSVCLILAFSLFSRLKSTIDKQSLEYICGKSLFAMFIGVLLTISTTSGLNVINTLLFILFGLIVSYLRITRNINSIDSEVNVKNSDHQETIYPTTRVVKKV